MLSHWTSVLLFLVASFVSLGPAGDLPSPVHDCHSDRSRNPSHGAQLLCKSCSEINHMWIIIAQTTECGDVISSNGMFQIIMDNGPAHRSGNAAQWQKGESNLHSYKSSQIFSPLLYFHYFSTLEVAKKKLLPHFWVEFCVWNCAVNHTIWFIDRKIVLFFSPLNV